MALRLYGAKREDKYGKMLRHGLAVASQGKRYEAEIFNDLVSWASIAPVPTPASRARGQGLAPPGALSRRHDAYHRRKSTRLRSGDVEVGRKKTKRMREEITGKEEDVRVAGKIERGGGRRRG